MTGIGFVRDYAIVFPVGAVKSTWEERVMWKAIRALGCAAVILVAAGSYSGAPAAEPAKSLKVESQLRAALESLTFDYSNEERRRHGLDRCKLSPALKFVARRHSQHLCVTGRFDHESPEFPRGWRTLESRLRRISVTQGGENIGYRTTPRDHRAWAAAMVSSWMESPTHRNNLLESRFAYMGVGVYLCDEVAYITQVFALEEGKTP